MPCNKPRQLPSLSTLPSLAAFAKYGVPRNSATSYLRHLWRIDQSMQDLFASYFLLSWKREYFLASMQDGLLERGGIVYQVRYYKTDPTKLRAIDQYSVYLSFRSLQPEYNQRPTVLVGLTHNGA